MRDDCRMLTRGLAKKMDRMQFALEHRLPRHTDKASLLYQLYTDPQLNQALAEMRHLKSREVLHLSVDEAANSAERIVRIDLDMRVPRAFKHLYSGADEVKRLGWEEHSTCDLSALTIDFDIRLPYLNTRIDAGGRYQLCDGDFADEALRRIDGHVRIDAPLVAKMAERAVVARLKESMHEEARLTAEYLHKSAA